MESRFNFRYETTSASGNNGVVIELLRETKVSPLPLWIPHKARIHAPPPKGKEEERRPFRSGGGERKGDRLLRFRDYCERETYLGSKSLRKNSNSAAAARMVSVLCCSDHLRERRRRRRRIFVVGRDPPIDDSSPLCYLFDRFDRGKDLSILLSPTFIFPIFSFQGN